MKESRDPDECNENESRTLSPEEISEILDECKSLTDEELSEILRECSLEHPIRNNSEQGISVSSDATIDKSNETEYGLQLGNKEQIADAPKRLKPRIDKDEVHRLYYERGLSHQKIAEIFGYRSTDMISKIFRENGWELRPRMPKKEIDPKKVYDLYFKEGLSLQKIAEHYGYTTGDSIKRIFREQGWKPRSRRKEIDPQEVYRLHHDEMYSVREIAKKFGYSTTEPIKRIFDENEWEIVYKFPPKHKISPQEVYRLYFEEELSLSGVTEHLGLNSDGAIRRVFKQQGWEFRAPYRKREIDSEEVYRLYYEEGFSLDDVGRHFGYKTGGPIKRVLVENDWEPRPSASTPRIEVDSDEAYRLYYEEGWSMQKVAEHFGYKSCVSMRRIFEKHGWSPRENESIDVKELRDELFGTKCVICDSDRGVVHKKDGEPHSHETLWTVENLKSLNLEEWVALCRNCHEITHSLMRNYDLDWNSIESILRDIDNKSRT